MLKRIFLLFFTFFSAHSNALTIKDITVVSENTPPFVFVNAKNEVEGIIAERVNKMLEILGVNSKIRVLPWARAYDSALREPYVMIFPLAKNEERDKLFKYAGIISNTPSFFYKLKSRKNITVNSIDEAKKYRIGVIREDVRYKFLLAKGFTGINQVNDAELNVRGLLGDRSDLIFTTELSLKAQLEKLHHSFDDMERVYEVKEIDGKRYLAFNKSTPDEIIDIVSKTALQVYKP